MQGPDGANLFWYEARIVPYIKERSMLSDRWEEWSKVYSRESLQYFAAVYANGFMVFFCTLGSLASVMVAIHFIWFWGLAAVFILTTISFLVMSVVRSFQTIRRMR